MGQLTKEFVAGMIRDLKLKKRPNLTLWELEQLAYSWLKLREPKSDTSAQEENKCK